jgi:hypothetical protein
MITTLFQQINYPLSKLIQDIEKRRNGMYALLARITIKIGLYGLSRISCIVP